MLSVLIGLTGVGKTSVAQEAIDHNECPPVRYLSYGDVMLDITKEEGLVEDRDELTELPPDKYDEIQDRVPHRIREYADDDNVVLDTHAALDTPTGYRPGLPKETLATLDPDNITFIHASTDEIRRRRKTDDSRNRTVPSRQKLEEHQNVAQSMAETGAVLSKCPLTLIENPRGKLHRAGERYAETLTRLADN